MPPEPAPRAAGRAWGDGGVRLRNERFPQNRITQRRIPRPKLTAATGLYNVARQVSGSIGIAIATTLLARDTIRYRAVLGEHVTALDLATRSWLGRVTAGLDHAGSDPATAARRALELLDLNLTQQASVLAYDHVFLFITILFVLGAPLVFLLRQGRPPAGHAEVAVE